MILYCGVDITEHTELPLDRRQVETMTYHSGKKKKKYWPFVRRNIPPAML